jgi:carbamoyl-phosphate synthase large subunit
MPLGGTAFVSVSDRDKRAIVLPVLRLQQLGFDILATEGTAEVLNRNGIGATVVRKYSEVEESGEGDSIVDLIVRNEVDVVINTPSGRSARADGYEIRASAVAGDKPLFTTIAELSAAVASIDAISEGFEVTSLQEYAKQRAARA